MSFTNTVRFIAGSGLANDGEIRLISSHTDNDAYVGPFQVFFSAFLGADTLHQSSDTADDSPEISYNVAGNGGYSVDIPLNDDGTYKAGTYRFTVKIWDEDSAAFIKEGEFISAFSTDVTPTSGVVPELDFDVSYDCNSQKITAIDKTPLDGWSTDVIGDWRVISFLAPPTIDEPEPVVETDTSASFGEYTADYTFGYTDAVYQVALRIFRFKLLSFDVVADSGAADVTTIVDQYERIGKTVSLEVVCDTTLCDVAGCLEEEYNRITALACGGGGWSNVPAQELAKWNRIQAMAAVANTYRLCGNTTKVAYWVSKIGEVVDCGCGCTDNGPRPYTSPYIAP